MSKVVINKDFDENDLKVGDILWYKNDDITSDDPHPHIIVGIEEGFVYTVCGTSQRETVERKIANYGYPDNSLFPAFGPDAPRGLRKITYFDCTGNFDIHKNTLQDKYQNGELVDKTGGLTLGEFDQIRRALVSHEACDIADLLVHPDE